MVKFNSPYAEQLLQKHQPNQRAYFVHEIGLQPNAANVQLTDEAYAELVSLGYVEKCTQHRFPVYQGGPPKNPFRITDAGLMAKK